MISGVFERQIGDREEWLGWRRKNVNASDAACLWGDDVHPFMSAYKLWALYSGKVSAAEENDAMKRGRRLEPVAIEMLQEEKPLWTIWRPGVYLEHPEWRVGATPDVYATIQGARANVQIKTTGLYAFKRHWIDQDTKEVRPPVWIMVQASIEAMLTGLDRAFVAVLVVSDGGNLDLHVVEVPMRANILPQLVKRAAEFWRRVENADPYPVNYERDAATVLEVFRDENGGEIDLSAVPGIDEKMTEHARLTEAIRAGEKAGDARKRINAWFVQHLGNARYGRVGPMLINAGNIKRMAHTIPATSYRFVRISGVK
jgi:predicted phage-related endonuclease